MTDPAEQRSEIQQDALFAEQDLPSAAAKVLRDHVNELMEGEPVSPPSPICASCNGKGYLTPDDAQRGIEAGSELFNAGYKAGKKAVTSPEALRAVVDAYELAQNNWSAQCFDFTKAPESMRRDAHEFAREGFNEIVRLLGVTARPILNSEYREAEQAAGLSPTPPEKAK